MSKPRTTKKASKKRVAPGPGLVPGSYLAWSRDPAVGLFAVLPLWLLYELLRVTLSPHERNGAEALMAQSLRALGPAAPLLMRGAFLLTVLLAAWSIHRRQVPWLRVAAVVVLEGTVYGLMLGPTAAALADTSRGYLAVPGDGGLAIDLVASLGAGVFEELVFRLGLVSLLALTLARPLELLRLSPWVGVGVAIVAAAALFAWFHHLGPGAPAIDRSVFLFRTAAGVVLGVLFVARGFGVCVYTHAMYDVHYYLTQAHG